MGDITILNNYKNRKNLHIFDLILVVFAHFDLICFILLGRKIGTPS